MGQLSRLSSIEISWVQLFSVPCRVGWLSNQISGSVSELELSLSSVVRSFRCQERCLGPRSLLHDGLQPQGCLSSTIKISSQLNPQQQRWKLYKSFESPIDSFFLVATTTAVHRSFENFSKHTPPRKNGPFIPQFLAGLAGEFFLGNWPAHLPLSLGISLFFQH